MAKLFVTINTKKDNILEDRLGCFRNDHCSPMPAGTKAVHFLRGVHSRAGIALSNYYLQLGARELKSNQSTSDYPMLVLAHALDFTSGSTISLCCRQVFDAATSGMTGKKFSKSSDTILEEVATYWANRSGREHHDARRALDLLQAIFEPCSKTNRELLNTPAMLARRVGLLKRHADAQGAHLSFDYFEFDFYDSAHVVAALALMGTIIHGFDVPGHKNDYFNNLDEAAWTAAKRVFPSLGGRRLFHDIDMSQLATMYCRMEMKDGADKILNQLPLVIGLWQQ